MCMRLLFFFGCGYVFRFSDCLTISAKYGLIKRDVEFRCDIIPYTGSQKWFVDAVQVSVCALIGCSNEPTNPARFSFTPNVSTGIFIFKISTIISSDHNKEVACYDGINKQSLRIDISVGQSGPSDRWCRILTKDSECIGLIVGCVICAIWSIGCMGWCFREKTTTKQGSSINVLLCIPIVGCIVIIIVECTKSKPDPPKQLKVAENDITETSITVEWTEGFDGGCKQTFFVIVNKRENEVQSTCKNGKKWSYMCTNLKSDTWYNIEIKAKNRKGWSEPCHDRYRTKLNDHRL